VLSLFKPKQNLSLGIDISSTSVKILELSITGEDLCVFDYGQQLFPENTIEGSLISNIDVVALTIKQVLAENNFSSKKAVIAVPDSAAISKVIQLDEGLTLNEIEEMVLIEADKYIPYPIDEINIDFNVLGVSSKNSAMQDVLIVASRSVNVQNRVEAVQQAGLDVVIVDVEAYAVERAAQLLKPNLPAAGENKVVAIIDVGAMYTHLFVMHGLKTIYSREEEFGGKQLVDAIMQQYGLKANEAMLAIERGTLPEDYHTRVLKPFNDMIFLQVKRALQFFFSTSQYNFVDHIVLAGGVAKQSGIAQLLQDHIGVPTTIANPMATMSFSKSVNQERIMQASPTLMVACGLALRRVE